MPQHFDCVCPRLVAITRLTAIGAIALLAACKGLDPIQNTVNHYGAVNIVAKSTSATSARASATVIFFEAVSAAVPSSAEQQNDQCAFRPFDSIPKV
ncbi:MAG: hypothetical protein ABIW79_04770, partial [Gemmatimonas sp.]